MQLSITSYDRYYHQPNIIQRAEIYANNIIDYSEDKEELRELFWRYLSNIYGDLCDPRISTKEECNIARTIFNEKIKERYPKPFKHYSLEVIRLLFECVELFRNRQECLIGEAISSSSISEEPFTSWLKNPSVSKFNGEYINREWWNDNPYKNQINEERKEILSIIRSNIDRDVVYEDNNLLLASRFTKRDIRGIQVVVFLERLDKDTVLDIVKDIADAEILLDQAMSGSYAQCKEWLKGIVRRSNAALI